MIKINNVEVNVEDILDIIPSTKTLIVKMTKIEYLNLEDQKKSLNLTHVLTMDIKNDVLFHSIKFKFLKFVKQHKDPEERVANFEWICEQGIPDFKRRDKLINSRKTSKEKEGEIDDLVKLIEYAKQNHLNCFSLKEELKNKLSGV